MGKIRETYHDQVSFQNVMGGLVKDVAQFHDPANNIGGDQVFEQVAAHWKDASSRHRMPVDERVFFDTKGTYRSTHPASIAAKAAEFQGNNPGTHYLRRLREAVATERRGIHAETIQIELAEETGLDVNQFKADLTSGKAYKAFQKDLNLCREQGVHGFPSYLLQAADGREIMLNGYVTFAAFDRWLREFGLSSRASSKQAPDAALLYKLVEKTGKMAPIEVSVIFEISEQEAQTLLDDLASNEMLEKHAAGTGSLYAVPKPDRACDVQSGRCV